MSVALIIENIDGKEISDYFPISTQESFKKIWIPICEQENYEWIPLFETGGTFTEEDLPYILFELNRFKEICHKSSFSKVDDIISRLDLILSNLEKVKGKKITFFIG